MSKQLFEEALADVKQVKQMAEDNARRAIFEAVTPRIREFIDNALLSENGLGEDEIMVDVVPVPGEGDAITAPDAEGKVTLDIDELCPSHPGAVVPSPQFGDAVPPGEEEYEISLESLDALRPLIRSGKASVTDVKKMIEHVNARTLVLAKASPIVKATRAYVQEIAQMVSRVDDMYGYVQESIVDPAVKSSCEATLEKSNAVLNRILESKAMSKKTTKAMNESDVTLKLTGLPDDIDLDSVGVDLITGEEDEEGGDAMGGDADDMGDLDLDADGDEGGQGEGEDAQMGESRRLSDDTIVEIDEGMLRREIARMQNLREETKPGAWGDGVGPKEFDDFGGASDEGDAVDQDVRTAGKVGEPLGEADGDDLEEADDLDEQDAGQDDMDQGVHAPQDMAMTEDDMGMDDLDQLQNRRKEEQFSTDVSDGHETATWDKRRHEAVKRLNFEKKLQERTKARASTLRQEASKARAGRNGKRLGEVKKEYAVVAQRYNESLARGNKLTKLVATATQKLQEARSNSAAKRPADGKADQVLRTKLAEVNLFNAKLLCTNKLLQTEMTNAQKARGIKQLDNARTVREVKLIYTSLVDGSTRKPMKEGHDRQIIGSSSRVARPASTNLNEGYETERWAQLAGITRR